MGYEERRASVAPVRDPSALARPARTARTDCMDQKVKPDDPGYRFIGKPIPRHEDARLVTGHGRFSADFTLDNQAYAAMVRSPHPHARIVKIDTEAARAM